MYVPAGSVPTATVLVPVADAPGANDDVPKLPRVSQPVGCPLP